MTSPVQPFLDISGFLALWDGPPLTAQRRAMATLLLTVASSWIYDHKPGIDSEDPAAKFVVYDVVSNAVRYQRYGKLQTYSKTAGHRMDAGSFAEPMKALEFTDTHKQLLGIPLEAEPMSSCVPNDFDADDLHAGWPTPWSGVGTPWTYP